ncbi:Protocadherin gamma-A8 [Schistosoma japonicum]|nr:Protocadherin gamma-A8 [Schistosoma japonicum]
MQNNLLIQNVLLKCFLHTLLLLDNFLIKSISVNEPNVFYVNDDTNEGQRIGRITHFNGNQQINIKGGNLKAVIVRGNRPPAVYFRLNENTGDLYTRTVIDRETLCIKQYQIDNENYNQLQRDINVDYSESNYQYPSLLSSNSKIVHQCKFTFQVALHRTYTHQQQQQPQHQPNEPGYPYLPEFIDIHVFVIDRNDHTPTFQPQSVINLSIPEGVPIGTRIQLPLAYDPDSPKFSVQRYELYPLTSTDFSLFTQTTDIIHNTNLIQEITGLYLEVKTTLDRELRESYTLEVKAFDSSVTDTVITSNLDSSKYSLTKYEFALNTDHIIKQLFKLNEHTGELFLKQPLDYEKHTTYSFNVLAIDSEYDRRSKIDSSNLHLVNTHLQQNIFTSTVNVLVNVLDINDEMPIIEIDYLRIDETTGRSATFARIEENNDPPQFIADILVTDRDVNAANSHIICTLMNKSNRLHNNTITTSFQLSEVRRQSGLVQYNMLTVRSLDREMIGSITRIRIQCSDSGEIKKITETDLIIHIIDLNDNSPLIQLIPQNHNRINSNENIVHLKENAPTGTIIAYFNVTDNDSGENSRTTCKLLSINDPILLNINEYFHIDPISCKLITRKSIDRESTYPPIDIIELTIEVSDHGQPIRRSNLNIKVKILNENDNPPIFQHTFYRFSIKENLPIGVNVGQIIISDLDGDYKRLNVKLQKQDQLPFQLWRSEISLDGYHSIDQTEPQVIVYYLNTTKLLDREEKSTYEFEIYANDLLDEGLSNQYKLSMKTSSYTTTTTVLITIEDENDNDPVIIFPQQSDKIFILSNLEKKYYQLMTVNANDKDLTSNSFIFMLEQENLVNMNNTTDKNIQLNSVDKETSKLSETSTNNLQITSFNSFLDIDRSIGTVYLNRDIQQNDTGTYIFRVIVHDSIINPRTASLRFIVKVEPIPPRSHQFKSITNLLHNNEHVEHHVISRENIMNSEFSNSNYDYYKLTNKENILLNRKYDNIKLLTENHTNPTLSTTISTGTSNTFALSKQFTTRRLTGDTVLILSLGSLNCQGNNNNLSTDYTALQTMTSCKCCTPPSPPLNGYTYNIDNIKHELHESFIIQPIKHNTLPINHISNGSISYYTTLSPRCRSEDTSTEKRKVRIMPMKENGEMEIEKSPPTEYLST